MCVLNLLPQLIMQLNIFANNIVAAPLYDTCIFDREFENKVIQVIQMSVPLLSVEVTFLELPQILTFVDV